MTCITAIALLSPLILIGLGGVLAFLAEVLADLPDRWRARKGRGR